MLKLLCIFSVSFVLIQSQKIPVKCRQLAHPRMMSCCKHRTVPPTHWPAEDEQCLKLGGKGTKKLHVLRKRSPFRRFTHISCAVEKCIANKRGILGADGTINNEALIKKYEEMYADYPEYLNKIKEHCLDVDKLHIYGHKEMCDVQKLSHCLLYQIANSCTEFFNTHICENSTALFNECKDAFNNN